MIKSNSMLRTNPSVKVTLLQEQAKLYGFLSKRTNAVQTLLVS